MKIYIIARHCEYEILGVFLSKKTANNFINDNFGHDNDAIYLHEEIIEEG